MGIDEFDPNNPRIQLIVMKQQLKFTDELNLLDKQLELKKQELLFLQKAIEKSKEKTAKKSGASKLQSILANLVFLSSTILVGFGINSLTSIHNNPQGWIMIILGIFFYFIGTIMTTYLVSGGRDE